MLDLAMEPIRQGRYVPSVVNINLEWGISHGNLRVVF